MKSYSQITPENDSAGNPSRASRNTAPQERRVDVIVTENADGRRQVLLRDLSYGSGIGWYAQKTIRLDPEQVEAILGSLCCAKQSCAGPSLARPRSAEIIQIGKLNRA